MDNDGIVVSDTVVGKKSFIFGEYLCIGRDMWLGISEKLWVDLDERGTVCTEKFSETASGF